MSTSFMGSRRERSERIHEEVLDRLDNLDKVHRKQGYSKRIKLLLDFKDEYKKEYEEWMKKKN